MSCLFTLIHRPSMCTTITAYPFPAKHYESSCIEKGFLGPGRPTRWRKEIRTGKKTFEKQMDLIKNLMDSDFILLYIE